MVLYIEGWYSGYHHISTKPKNRHRVGVRKNDEKALIFVLIIAMVLLLGACSSENTLSGNYVSESGKYEIEFKKDNTCIWYQTILDSEVFFEGTYEKEGDLFVLHIKGDGFLTFNTIFEAKPTENGLIITGGTVNGELFVKK